MRPSPRHMAQKESSRGSKECYAELQDSHISVPFPNMPHLMVKRLLKSSPVPKETNSPQSL
jgi:hypothetical protein